MKKIISIVCIVALLVTSIGMTFTNVAAAPITAPDNADDTVIWSTFTDDDGNDWYPYGPSDAPIPESVVSSGTGSIIKDTTGLPSTGLFSIPTEQYNENGDPITESILCTKPISVSGINGIMVYVEVPEVEGGYDLRMKLRVYDASQEKFGYKYRATVWNTGTTDVYAYHTMPMGAFSFDNADYDSTGNGKLILPSGFKGYVYYLLNECTSQAGGIDSGALADDDAFAGLHFTLTSVPGEELIVGTPIAVKGTRNSTLAAPTDTITVGGFTYKLDGSGLVEDVAYTKPSFNKTITTASVPTSASYVAGTEGGSYTVTTDTSATPLTDAASVTYSQVSKKIKNMIHNSSNMVLQVKETTTGNGIGVEVKGGYLLYVNTSANTDPSNPVFLDLVVRRRSSTASAHIAGPTAYGTFGVADPKVYCFKDDPTEENSWEELQLPKVMDTNNIHSDNMASLGIQLETGFKGYVYIPVNVFEQNITAAATWFNPGAVEVYMLSQAETNANVKYKVSSLMVISSANGFDPTSTIISSNECVLDLDTGKKIGAPNYTVSDTFYGDADQINVNSAPTVRPATMARPDILYHPLNSLTANHYNASYSLGVSGRDNRNGGGVAVSIEDKFVPIIDDLPAVTVATTDSFVTNANLATFLTNDVLYKNSGVIVYIKNHDNVPKSISGSLNEQGLNTSFNDFNVKMLAKGASFWSWVNVDKGATTFTIPENFEGYLYFYAEGYKTIATALGTSDSVSLTHVTIEQADLVAGQTMTISFPMVITNSPVSQSDVNDFFISSVAYVNDADVPQNLNTDNFAIPYDHNGDLKVNVLDLARAYSEQTADYTLLRKNYLNVAEDAELVIANPS